MILSILIFVWSLRSPAHHGHRKIVFIQGPGEVSMISDSGDSTILGVRRDLGRKSGLSASDGLNRETIIVIG